MSNTFLDNVMDKYTPFPGSPVDFYYKQASDGGSSFAMYDSASGMPIHQISYPAAGTTDKGLPSPCTGPVTVNTQDGQPLPPMYLCKPPIPFCPFAFGYWNPAESGMIGFAIVMGNNPPVAIMSRECGIGDNQVELAGDMPIIGHCQCTLKWQSNDGSVTEVSLTVQLGPITFPTVTLPI